MGYLLADLAMIAPEDCFPTANAKLQTQANADQQTNLDNIITISGDKETTASLLLYASNTNQSGIARDLYKYCKINGRES